MQDRFHGAISPLDPKDVSPWRVVDTYAGTESSTASLSKVTPEFAYHMVEARRCSLIAAEEVAGVQGITDVSETIVVNATDLRRLGLIQDLRRDPKRCPATSLGRRSGMEPAGSCSTRTLGRRAFRPGHGAHDPATWSPVAKSRPTMPSRIRAAQRRTSAMSLCSPIRRSTASAA